MVFIKWWLGIGLGSVGLVLQVLFAILGESSWVLFRFLYGGQLADPCLIIHIDDVGWSAVSERFV